ncbi:MAG: DUF2914 domain-containing protein [Acidobacteria bacterium]|nr:DUF2914 domain-containing protein [Acidobacteriota bacterium]
MRCPTCNKRVGKGEPVCPYCGGMVAGLAVREEPLSGLSAQDQGEAPGEPLFRQPEERESEEEEDWTSVPQQPEVESPVPSPPPPPSLLFRLLLPLIFLLIPLFNFLFWDSPINPWSRTEPVLEQSVFCEGIQQGLPVNPKTVFSLRQDPQVVFYSRWGGSRRTHTFLLRWFTPEGNLYKTTAMLRFQLGREEFSTYTALPLEVGMSLGDWRVEVVSDQKVVGRLTFRLQE